MGLAAISYDPVSVLADFAKRRGITFPLLSDQGSEVIRKYGLLNTTVADNSPVFGVPFPGTLVLDSHGLVRARSFEVAYQERDTVNSILLELDDGQFRAAASTSTPHLALGTQLTDETVAPGTVFSILVEVTPGPRMHVYAPGAKGYKAVALSIDPQPGLIVRPLEFPSAEDYYFKPLDEHVPVYQHTFRLLQPLVIDASRAGQEALKGVEKMVIRGKFTYQACDDATCFPPVSLALSWTVTLKPLDRERAAKR